MSFILDALRRAESLRGNQPRPVAADTPLGNIAEPNEPPLMSLKRVLTLLAGAAVVATVAVLLTRPDKAPVNVASTTPAAAPGPAFSGVASNTPLAEVAAAAGREIRPLDEVAGRAKPPAPPATTRKREPGTVTLSQQPLEASDRPNRNIGNVPAQSTEQLPSYETLLLSGRANLPVLHLDIHVYAEQPERRFVFVNNRKYREGDELDDGGTVERITSAGVILNHGGHRFELAPE